MHMPFLVVPVVAAFAAAVPAGAVTLADVSRAMEATATMEARFAQQSVSGVATGTLRLKRPGRIRFDYDHNKDQLIVANGRRLSFVDYKVRQVTEWPLAETPLGVLLDPRDRLPQVAKVLPEKGGATTVAVAAQDPKHPEQGRIVFYLAREAAAPGGLELTGWQVTDSQGNLTTVTLSDIRLNQPLKDSVFSFRDPRPRSGPPGRPN